MLAMPHQPRPRVLSGMQPTAGSLHLGNYLGALRQWVGAAGHYETFYFVADLHAITVRARPGRAAGAHPGRRRRSTSPPGVDLGAVHAVRPVATCRSTPSSQWVLGCITGFGEASRMTQFKDKAARGGGDNASVGLFTYPILQAADILLYQAHQVPVGEDQRQHIELTRDLAQRFNHRFGDTFRVPEPYILRETAKIYDLQIVDKQMSKSIGGSGVVWLMDDPKAIEKKIRSAVTDTGREILFDPVAKPGVSNLLGDPVVASVASRCRPWSTGSPAPATAT